MENNSKIITIKSNRGLSSIITQNGNLKPQLFRQKVKDPNGDGEYAGDYDGRPFAKSTRFFAPEWDNLRKQWHFSGDDKTFRDVVAKLRLKYPKGHRNSGDVIVAGDLKEHLRDFTSPIFKNEALYGRLAIESGSGSLNMEIPLQEFAYYCERDRRDIIDETSDKTRVNSARRAGARFILSSPKQGKIKKAETADTFMAVMEKLISIQNDEQKLRAACALIGVPHVNERSDIVDLKGALTETLRENLNKPDKLGSYRTIGEAFIAYVDMPSETLQYRYVIAVAKKKGLIRIDKDGFRMEGSFISGPKDMNEIYSYLTSSDEKASEQFANLMMKMKELKYI